MPLNLIEREREMLKDEIQLISHTPRGTESNDDPREDEKGDLLHCNLSYFRDHRTPDLKKTAKVMVITNCSTRNAATARTTSCAARCTAACDACSVPDVNHAALLHYFDTCISDDKTTQRKEWCFPPCGTRIRL